MKKLEKKLNIQTNADDKRIEYLDLLRIIAIFTVVLLHVAAQNWTKVDARSFEWNVFNVFDSISRWAVPVFVMISGTLFLNKDYTLKELWLKKILRIIIVYFFWALAYSIICGDRTFGSILNNTINGWYHLWFLFMIAGLYMVTPILKKIIESEQITKYFLIVTFFITFLIPTLLNFITLFNNEWINNIVKMLNSHIEEINICFGYTSYFVLGYYLNKKDISKKNRIIIYILGIVGAVSTILLMKASINDAGEATGKYYSNFSLNILLEAIAVFVFAKYNFKTNKFVKEVSKYSFGIYLVHAMILNELYTKFNITTCSFYPLVSVPIITIAVFIVSTIISAIINQIPILKKYIV